VKIETAIPGHQTPGCTCDTDNNTINCSDVFSTNHAVGTICYDQWHDAQANNYPRSEKYEVKNYTSGSYSYTNPSTLIFNDLSTPNWTYSIRNKAGSLEFISGSATNPRVIIGADGNVGIGLNTAAEEQLDVNGNVKVRGQILMGYKIVSKE
jgi:hypothetical protein